MDCVYTEADGCRIMSDLALAAFQNNLLMLHGDTESWTPNFLHMNTAFQTGESSESALPDLKHNHTMPASSGPTVSIISEAQVSQACHAAMGAPEFITVQFMDTNNELAGDQEDPAATAPIVVPAQHVGVAEASKGTTDESGNSEQSEDTPNMIEQQVVQQPGTSKQNQEADVQLAGCSASGDVENQSPNSCQKWNHPDGVQLQKSNKKHASTEMKFRCFDINWTKISDHVLVRLRAMQDFKNANPGAVPPVSIRITKNEKTTLTTGIVDQLRMIDTRIGANIMEDVSRKILQKFPALESTDDDGFGARQGYVDLKYKMINRNNYLNNFQTTSTKTSKTTTLKKCRNARAGTLKEYWLKSSNQSNREMLSKLSRDEPSLLTDEFLYESQAYIRFRLDDKIDTVSMLSQLPVIRRRTLLNFHFEKSTGVNVSVFRKYFSSKREKIIAYSLSCKSNLQLQDTSPDIDILKFLCSLVGENFSDLVHLKEIGTRLDDITFDSPGPVLVAVDIGNGKTMFYVYANEARLSEGACDIVTAVEDLFSVHFVHNFMYPKSVSKFLELLQENFSRS